MKKKFKKMTFSGQLILYYLLVFLTILTVCVALYVFTVRSILSESENNTLEYGLQIAEQGMDTLLENVDNCSRVISFNDTVQHALRVGQVVSYDDRTALQEAVIQIAACYDGISSVYLFDNDGESYIAGEISDVDAIRNHLKEHSFFQSALYKQNYDASATIITFAYATGTEEQKQNMSFVRRVRNLNTLEDIGTLVINIPERRVMEVINTITEETGMEAAILGQDNTLLASSEHGDWLMTEAYHSIEASGEAHYAEMSQDGDKYKVGMTQSEEYAWTIVGAIPKSVILSNMLFLLLCSVALLLCGIGMCVFGSTYFTRRIIRPLSNILTSMEHVKKGTLERVPLIETNREMDDLQQHYNRMLAETEMLMQQKVEEQRMRRKYEMALLQEQIKPHFLYNTFDSVCALIRLGRTDDAYTMMRALGQYYRNSLNKGKTMISIREELDIVRNYLIIQSFRYDDVFNVRYEVDEAVEACQTIKLILQPLVENAIYHGFRENDLEGTITIRAKDAGEFVMLQVEDDGIGMESEKLCQLLEETPENMGKRFGLPGTIRRINLYYQYVHRNLVDIKSEIGHGTTITVWIPKGE